MWEAYEQVSIRIPGLSHGSPNSSTRYCLCWTRGFAENEIRLVDSRHVIGIATYLVTTTSKLASNFRGTRCSKGGIPRHGRFAYFVILLIRCMVCIINSCRERTFLAFFRYSRAMTDTSTVCPGWVSHSPWTTRQPVSGSYDAVPKARPSSMDYCTIQRVRVLYKY